MWTFRRAWGDPGNWSTRRKWGETDEKQERKVIGVSVKMLKVEEWRCAIIAADRELNSVESA